MGTKEYLPKKISLALNSPDFGGRNLHSTFLFAKLLLVELSDGKQNTAYRCKRISRSETGTKI